MDVYSRNALCITAMWSSLYLVAQSEAFLQEGYDSSYQTVYFIHFFCQTVSVCGARPITKMCACLFLCER